MGGISVNENDIIISSPAQDAAPGLVLVTVPSAGLPAAAEGEKPGRYPNRFKPGQSGNLSGRPKKTEAEKAVLEQIKSLAPKAVIAAQKILDGERAAAVAKVQVISLILSYDIGKPETSLKLNMPQQSIEASEARIEALIRGIRIESAPSAEEADGE